MVIKRRKRIGKPLLTATVATTITFASCYMNPVGNLMIKTSLCVDVTPDHAELMVHPIHHLRDFNPDGGIDGDIDGIQIDDEECIDPIGFGFITAKAQGFVDVKIDLNYKEYETNDLTIDMVPINSSDAGTSDAGTNEPSDGGE